MEFSLRLNGGLAAALTCLALLLASANAWAASDLEAPIGQEQPAPIAQPSPSELKPGRELPALRSEDSDTYEQADGSRLLKISLHPINYKVANTWQPINDQLEQGADGSSHPVASPTPVSFPGALDTGAVSVGPSGRELSFSLEGASASGVATGATATYLGALPGVDVAYATSPESVRETLTLASASSPTTYRYDLALSSGLKASLEPSGGVAIRDDSGQLAYSLGTPSVDDSSGTEHLPWTAPVHYELSSDGTVLSLVLDKAWLEDSSRVFPVKIDPDVYFGAARDCTIVNGSYANTSLCGERLYVGKNSEGVARSLLKFDTSSIPRGSAILSSSLALWFESATSSSPMEIEAYALKEHEFTHAGTWNDYDGAHPWATPGGDVLKTQAGAQIIKHEYLGGWVNIGFSPQVEQWVRDSTSNDGILLKSHSETTTALDKFVQSDNCEEHEPEPNLNVVYEPRMGNPANGQMYQLPIANGGTLGVNVANGNLHISDPDVRYSSSGYATELARSYNTFDDGLVGSSFGTEGAWRLNMGEDELLYPAWWDESNAFHQPDGSYTRFDRAPWADGHPAVGDKAYTGEAYVGAGLTVHENGTRTLKYSNGVEWLFDNSTNGFPQKIVDAGGEGNTISLSYTSSHLTEAKDTHGHALTLTRETGSNYITKIAGVEKSEIWKYTYKEGRLITFTNPAKEKAKYTYYKSGYENGLLESIADESGTWVIVYDTSDRVASLRKLVNGTIKKAGTEDQITTFSYETEQTTATNPEGGKGVYYYDEFGNVLESPVTQEAAAEFYAGYASLEASVATKDVNLQDHAVILDTQLSAQLGTNYTGEWFDAKAGEVRIGVTSKEDERTVVQDLDNLGLSDNTEVVIESASVEQLETATTSLAASLKTLISEELVAIGLAVSQNAVRITKTTGLSTAQNKQISEATAGLGVPTVVIEEPPANLKVTAAACAGALCGPPLRGGVYIEEHATKPAQNCTAGFLAWSKYTVKPYIMTAGHCIYDGGVGIGWESAFPGDKEPGDRYIGHSSSTFVYGSRGDVGLIEVDPASPFIKPPGSSLSYLVSPLIVDYGGTGTPRNEEYPIIGTHSNPRSPLTEQFPICVGGGTFVEATDEARAIERCGITLGRATGVNVSGVIVPELQLAKVCGGSVTSGLVLGTSGSPVYKVNRAYGVESALTGGNGCIVAYQDINKADATLGVSVTGP